MICRFSVIHLPFLKFFASLLLFPVLCYEHQVVATMEKYSLAAVNAILDTYTSLKKLNHLSIFRNALNLLEKEPIRCILLERENKSL